MGKRVVVLACLALLAAGCSSDEPSTSGDVETSATVGTSPTATVAPDPEPVGRTIELRYRVKPTNETLLSIKLPPQQPGGTLISWSAYFQGVGNTGTPANPLKVECYVVQATGPDFGDRILYVADDSTYSLGDDVSVSGSGLVDTADGKRLTFECELDENVRKTIPGLEWQTHPQQPIQVTLTPVEHERREVTIK